MTGAPVITFTRTRDADNGRLSVTGPLSRAIPRKAPGKGRRPAEVIMERVGNEARDFAVLVLAAVLTVRGYFGSLV